MERQGRGNKIDNKIDFAGGIGIGGITLEAREWSESTGRNDWNWRALGVGEVETVQ